MQFHTEAIILRPSLQDIFSLPPLFTQAVHTDFSFYNEPVKQRIMKKNSLLRLFFARLRKRRVLLVAKISDKCVGVVIGSHTASIGNIHWLFVLPEYRGNKIGSALLARAEAALEKFGCHKVALTTEIAPEFYKKLGYTVEGFLKKHWWKKDFTILSKSFEKIG